MLHENVYDALCVYGVKKLFRDNSISYKEDSSKENMISLLNDVDDEILTPFLINSFLYGLQRNIYVSKIRTFSHTLNIENANGYIKSLGFKNCNLVNDDDNMFIHDIKSQLDINEKTLIYSNLNQNENGNLTSIDLIFGEGFKDSYTENDINLYYSICIDIDKELLIIRLRNFETRYSDYNIDEIYFSIKNIVRNKLGVIVDNSDEYYMKLMYNAVSDLTDTILNRPYSTIETLIGESIDNISSEWNTSLFENNVTPSDALNLKKTIINSYCKLKMREELKGLSVYDLKSKYNVDGYTRSINFIDDSVSKINTKSKEVEESLLDTTSFYDIKSSLDHSKNVRNANIHWFISDTDRLNTTFVCDKGGRFKVVIKSNHFNKEVDDYVLQKVIRYAPQQR